MARDGSGWLGMARGRAGSRGDGGMNGELCNQPVGANDTRNGRNGRSRTITESSGNTSGRSISTDLIARDDETPSMF